MPRPRITLRWLMLAIAIVAATMGAIRLRQIAADHASRAAQHRAAALWIEAELGPEPILDHGGLCNVHRRDWMFLNNNSPAMVPDQWRTRESWRRLAMWHRALSREYRRAAAAPWVFVSARSPEPW